MANHYEILGVPKDADAATIKKAHRKAARLHHPDKGGDTAAFQAIQRAYEVLSDPERRARFDAGQEDRAVDNDHAEILQHVASLLLQTLARVANPKSFDVHAMMLQVLHDSIGDARRRRQQAVDRQAMLSDVAARFTVKDDRPNYISDMIRAEAMKLATAGIDRDINRLERMLKFVEGYQYKCEASPLFMDQRRWSTTTL